MSKNIRTEEVDHLFDAILSLSDKEECFNFFEDLCTVQELKSISGIQKGKTSTESVVSWLELMMPY